MLLTPIIKAKMLLGQYFKIFFIQLQSWLSMNALYTDNVKQFPSFINSIELSSIKEGTSTWKVLHFHRFWTILTRISHTKWKTFLGVHAIISVDTTFSGFVEHSVVFLLLTLILEDFVEAFIDWKHFWKTELFSSTRWPLTVNVTLLLNVKRIEWCFSSKVRGEL